MAALACHPPAPTGIGKAREIILKQLGVRKVAGWCGVGESTVHQWLSRGTDDQPLPPAHIPAIVAGARSEGHDLQPGDLWPAAAGVLRAASLTHVRAAEDLA